MNGWSTLKSCHSEAANVRYPCPPKRSFTLTSRRTLPYLSMGMSGIKSTLNKSAILNGRPYRLTTYRNKEIYQRIINTRPLRMEFIAFAIPRLYAISAA